MPKLDASTRFALDGAPEGMVIQSASGVLHWTPASPQQGTRSVTIVRSRGSGTQRDTLDYVVSAGAAEPAGIYVSPSGRASGAGTPADPLASVQDAADRASPGTTIYLRGGRYFNEGYGTAFDGRSKNNLARITTAGTAAQPITLRPWGNEYATLISDVNGLAFSNTEYWRVTGLELQGSAETLSRAISLENWWKDGDSANRIQGRGIAMNSSYQIEITQCLIHHFSGAGLSNTDGANITVADNLIYDNAWWSTSGTHGFANSKPVTRDNSDTTSFKIVMQRNLVWGNQSSMISHVFSKGFVTLEIDEGNGLHMQNNGGAFVGRFLAEDNLVVHNGKAGIGLNTVDGSVIRRNSFYANVRAVASAGELSLQSSASGSIINNLFHALTDRRTIRDFQDAYTGVGSNYAVPSADSAQLPPSITQVPKVFTDPANGDFRPDAGIPNGYGPDASVLSGFATKLADYGLTPAPASTLVDAAYVRALRQEILARWPAPVANDGIPDDLVLEDPETGYCYAYADHKDYPNAPSSGTRCSK